MLTVSVLISCEEASSDSDTTESSGAIIATQTLKRADTDVRDSYGIFTIKTDRGSYTDYHLAVKEASATAPTATEMASGALKRNISSTAIHVLIAQRLNAPMVTFAKAYFADNTQKTLGTDMTGTLDDDKDAGAVYDAVATGTNAWVKESVLKSETEYVLYGMIDGGTEVKTLLSFTTDAIASHESTGVADNELAYIDTTLEQGHITLSVNSSEFYIFPIHFDFGGGVQSFQLSSTQAGGNLIITYPNFSVFGGILSGFAKLFYMAKNIAGNAVATIDDGLKAYILINTASLNENVYYGSSATPDTGATPSSIKYSTLSPQ